LQLLATGNELIASLRGGQWLERQVLRIGAVSTLSRNFHQNLVKPLLLPGRSDHAK